MSAAARKPEPEPIRSYSDWLKANRKSREWKIEPVQKKIGDWVATGTDIVRIGGEK